jgi:hypothetical protein
MGLRVSSACLDFLVGFSDLSIVHEPQTETWQLCSVRVHISLAVDPLSWLERPHRARLDVRNGFISDENHQTRLQTILFFRLNSEQSFHIFFGKFGNRVRVVSHKDISVS